jgi:carboxypeptidase PM20D1
MLAKQPGTNAMLRTTTAMTVFNAGNKENVLPGRAEAIVNFRLLPGDSAETVVAHVRRAVADDRIEVAPVSAGMPASRVSSTESDAYRRVERTLREVFPGTLVAPGLMLGGTDARHFEDIADHVLRFSPLRAGSEDLKRFHGTDERLSVDQLADMVRFYHRLVQQAAGS